MTPEMTSEIHTSRLLITYDLGQWASGCRHLEVDQEANRQLPKRHVLVEQWPIRQRARVAKISSARRRRPSGNHIAIT